MTNKVIEINFFVRRIYTINNEVVFNNNKHNHTPDLAKIIVREAMANIRDDAKRNTLDIPHNVVTKCTASVPQSALMDLPSLRNMRQSAK